MRNRFIKGTIPLACAAMLLACGGSDDRREEQQPQDRMASAQQQVTLTGCVQPGSLQTQFVLENVRTDQQAAQQRPDEGQTRDPARPDDPQITRWTQVQLQSENAADLKQYLGQEVRVTGTMTNIADRTVGTGGAQGTHEAPSGDKSMAGATGRSDAEKKRAEAGPIAQDSTVSGRVPILRVGSVSPTGQKCTERTSPGGPPK